MVVSGELTGQNTGSWSVGDAIYVSETTGALTNVKPTGTALIQKIAQVTRSNVSVGVLQVFGAGRSNDLPNIAQNNLWMGDGSGVPTATSRSGIDDTAIHDDTAAEISAITAKATPTTADYLLIEDAADSNNKKSITVGDLPAAAPASHASTHENGGGDEISVAGLSGALADPQTPSSHASTHEPGGSDTMTVDAIAATGSLRTLGTGAQQACAGNDARLSDARTPTSHASSHENGGGDEISVAGLSGTLADPQTPSSHASSHQHGGADEVATATPAANAIPKADGSGSLDAWVTGGSGDVVGPASATDEAVARYDGTTGKLIQDSGVKINDSGYMGINTDPISNAALKTTGICFPDFGVNVGSTVTYDDYDVGLYSNFQFHSATGDFEITGLDNEAAGKLVIIHNVTDYTLTIRHQDTGSLLGNRFDLPNDTDIALDPNGAAAFTYGVQGSGSAWRIVTSVGGTDTSKYVTTVSAWTLSGGRYYADVTHSLGTKDVVVSAYTVSDDLEVGLDDIDRTDTNTVRIWSATNTEDVRVIVIAANDGTVPGPHNIQSHTDTTATGAQLNELVGGGSTTLHSHAAQKLTIPATDTTVEGWTMDRTVDTDPGGFGVPMYMASDGNLDPADADAASTMPCVVLSTEAGTGTREVLLKGIARNDAWSWTPGQPIYVSTTVGALTQTAPSGAGDLVQRVGWAITADVMLFEPGDLTVIEVSA